MSATTGEKENVFGDKSLITFVGDIQLSGDVGKKIISTQSNPFQYVASELKRSQICIGNLEFPASEKLKQEFTSSRLHLASKAEHFTYMKDAGFTLLTLANNHIADWGSEGIELTRQSLDALGLGYFGAGKNEAQAAIPYMVQSDDTHKVYSVSPCTTICAV